MDGTPIPPVVKNRLDDFFNKVLQEPGSVTLTRADELLNELAQTMRMGGMKTNATAVNFAEKFAESMQAAARKVDLGEAGQAARLRYDELWTQGQMLMNSPVAKQLGLSEKNALRISA